MPFTTLPKITDLSIDNDFGQMNAAPLVNQSPAILTVIRARGLDMESVWHAKTQDFCYKMENAYEDAQ